MIIASLIMAVVRQPANMPPQSAADYFHRTPAPTNMPQRVHETFRRIYPTREIA